MGNQIHYIKHNNIDFSKWDQLVQTSKLGTVYSYSWWLSTFSEWDLIILNDYQAGIVVPKVSVILGNKMYQPNFVQQCLWLGEMPDDALLITISKLIESKTILAHFNSNLKLPLSTKTRKNQVLNIQEISEVKKHYSKSLSKNIKNNKPKVSITENQNVQLTIDKYTDAYGSFNTQLTHQDYSNLKKLSVSNPDNFINLTISLNDIDVAGLLFAKGKNRLHYILGAPTLQGRKVNAISIGINYIIETYGDSYPILDFEGSSIPSVHKFYKSFGSEVIEFYEATYVANWVAIPLRIYKRFFKSKDNGT
jgi:hypothetical protein